MSDDEILDLTGKKKKGKKPKVVVEAEDDEEKLVLGEKKKKRKDDIIILEDESKKGEEAVDIGHANLSMFKISIVYVDSVDSAKEWPDYAYDELLDLVFGIMKEKNPELTSGDKKKFVMKPPQVARAGSKKTAFTNFSEICRLLKRQTKHVLQFLLAELGTTGSIDGNQCLIVKGRFQQKHFESVLRKYIKEYVTCHTCRSSDTELTKDTRLNFLQCQTCGSRCSVGAIKSGFTAMVGKRAALRRNAEATGAK